MESQPTTEEKAAQRNEEREELEAGIDQLQQDQRNLADQLQQDQHEGAAVQEQVARKTKETRQFTESLKPSPKQESE